MSDVLVRGPGTARRGLTIRMAGDAAHGLLFAGYVLAEAAHLERRTVAHAPTLGAAARGPLSGGALRIGGGEEEYPLVDAADCLLLTSEAALARFGASLAPEGWLLVESSVGAGAAGESGTEVPAKAARAPQHALLLPLVRTAIEAGGTPLVVDLVAAAVVTAITGAVSRRALHDGAARLLPERSRPAGFAALEAGMELGKSRVRA